MRIIRFIQLAGITQAGLDWVAGDGPDGAPERARDLVERITKHLKKGERIRMAGLGILQVRKRPARMGRNPATGEAIKIKASKKVAFRAAKELKEAV